MPSSPLWKLRRLAPRAKRIQGRRSDESPVIAAYSHTLPPKADAFVAAYDEAAKHDNTWRREMNEGKGAVAQLLAHIKSWLPLLERDVPQFQVATFGDKPDIPDDVIEDGARMLEILGESTDAQGNGLPYARTAADELNSALALANREWAEAEAADSTHQKLLERVRATAAVFDTDLQAFRRTLGHVVGRNDKDYQRLRAERVLHTDQEEEGDMPPPVKP